MYSKKLPLAGLPNTRDLGGFPTGSGLHIAPNKLIRSGMLFPATPEALARLVDEYRLRAIVDFRTEAEQRERPDPALPGVTHISNPILESLTAGITHEEAGLTPLQNLTRSIHMSGMTATQFMSGLYRSMIRDEFSQRQYARFFDILSEERDGATLWHCTVGKDRVGVGTAMLLLALGASVEDAVDDYLATQLYYQDVIERDAAEVERALNDPDAADTVRALNGVCAEYITTAFEEMRAECGTVEGYLESRIGLTASKTARLRALYLA
ncbi:MAG: tyrosine-protein phosphatase [Clostridia bacterium]|nr:tyrosine-protein phosphatase [Clostridia bacterium]